MAKLEKPPTNPALRALAAQHGAKSRAERSQTDALRRYKLYGDMGTNSDEITNMVEVKPGVYVTPAEATRIRNEESKPAILRVLKKFLRQ